MQVLHPRCAGIDVHKKTAVVCVLVDNAKPEIKTFPTFTKDIVRLSDWLESKGVTHVAMESTGVYWKPLWNILEAGEMHLMLVNAHHLKQVPGRKTDVKDAEWLAQLLRHGLLKGSLIPHKGQRELKELVRYRRSKIHERTREVQRLQKVLEAANIKLDNVISDIVGVSGTAMLRCLVDGVTDPAEVAKMAHRTLKARPEELQAALQGGVSSHQRLMMRTILQTIEFLDTQVEQLNKEVEERMRPFADEVARVDSIPGFALRAAQEVLAEIGFDMSKFPTAKHLASWACVCPGQSESGGKKMSARTRRGNPWLRAILNEAALGSIRKKDCYFGCFFRRIAARRGANRAKMAVSRTLLEIVWHILNRGTCYEELGSTYLDNLEKEALINSHVKRLKKLGYTVTLSTSPAA